MSLSSHLSELKKKHAILSDKVEAAQRSPGTDGLRVAGSRSRSCGSRRKSRVCPRIPCTDAAR